MELARGAGAALVDRLAGTTFNWAQPYHDIANDVTQLLVRYCSVPVAAAPALALTAVLFIPLFFSAALFLSTWGYHGHPRCGPSLAHRRPPALHAQNERDRPERPSCNPHARNAQAPRAGGRWPVRCPRSCTAA